MAEEKEVPLCDGCAVRVGTRASRPWSCSHDFCAACTEGVGSERTGDGCPRCAAPPQVFHLPIFPVETVVGEGASAAWYDVGPGRERYGHKIWRYPPSLTKRGSLPNQGDADGIGCGFNMHWLEEGRGTYALFRTATLPDGEEIPVGVGQVIHRRGAAPASAVLKPSDVQAEWLAELADESDSDEEGNPRTDFDTYSDSSLAFVEACAHGCVRWARKLALLEDEFHRVDVHFREGGAARLCLMHAEEVGAHAKGIAKLLTEFTGDRKNEEERDELLALASSSSEHA